MMMTIISRKMTGRCWGQKVPFKVVRTFVNDHGVRSGEFEADFWCGPTEPGERGQYERIRWIESASYGGVARRSTTSSFETELTKALGGRA